MRVALKTIIDTTNAAADVVSEELDIRQVSVASMQVVWTSTSAAFAIDFEVSNDGENWVSAVGDAIADDSGNIHLTLVDNAHAYGRFKAKRTSGTVSTLKVIYCGKSL